MHGSLAQFLSSGRSSARNGSFTSNDICGMLKPKSYTHVDYVFPLVTAVIDRICGQKNSTTSMTSILYIRIINRMR